MSYPRYNSGVHKQPPQHVPSKKVIAIVGPTASGKSSLGVYLAQKLGGEVVSADSRQVYKGLDIGTGKVTKKEMAGVPHHLLSIVSPKKQFTVDDFVKLATKAIEKTSIYRRIPIVVGGTGLYVDTLLGRMSYPAVPPNPALRAKLEKKSVEQLFTMLKKLDPARAEMIDARNPRRLVRAIEVAKWRNKKNSGGGSAARPALDSSDFSAEKSSTPMELLFAKPNILWLGINPTDLVLKKNINSRLAAHLSAGMIAEAKRLHKAGLSYTRMEELGLEYKYLARFLQNKTTKEELVATLQKEIWHYAKRQRTWFKRNTDIHWVTSKGEALRLAKSFISS